MKFATTALTAALLLAGSQAAQAQDANVQGEGYQLSERTVLNTSVGAEAGVVSNVFFQEDSGVLSPLLRILARMSIDPVAIGEKGGSPPTFVFSAGVRFAYEEFLSGNGNARQQRNLGIGADLMLGIKPASTFPITITDNFIRTNRPTNFESSQVLSRDINRFKLGARYQPAGRNVSGRASYQNTIDIFESDKSAFANRLLNKFTLGVDWQFLPITKFFLEGNYSINGGLGTDSQKVSSQPISGIAGVHSAITENITIRAHLGYAYGPYSTGASFQGLLAHAEGGLRYSPTGRFRLIYDKNFTDSINANFFGEHLFKAVVNQQLGRVSAQANIAARIRTYQGVSAIFGGGAGVNRDDFILSAGARASFLIRDNIAIHGSYEFASVNTDFRSNFGGEADDPSFNRHQFLVGASTAF